MTMSRPIQWFAAALAALLIQGCTGAQVRVDFDPKADFQALRSYAWAPMTEAERQEKSRNSLTHERIQSAIDAHLSTRVYAKVDEAQADYLGPARRRRQIRAPSRHRIGVPETMNRNSGLITPSGAIVLRVF